MTRALSATVIQTINNSENFLEPFLDLPDASPELSQLFPIKYALAQGQASENCSGLVLFETNLGGWGV